MSKSNPLYYIDVSRITADKKSAVARITNFKEIYSTFDKEQAKNQASRCLDCGTPYCEWKCPLHNYIPNWLELVQEGKLNKAADLVHKTNPLPEICGIVCPQDKLCEGACTLDDEFGAVTIGSIEKYIAEQALESGWSPDISGVIKTGYKVAIIGAGPAGLGCADILIRNGINVSVFDRNPEIGGLLTFGIPSFKLDKKVISRRRKVFESMGVNFHLNININDKKFGDLLEDYDAIFMGLGAYNYMSANIKGETSKGVYQALTYLESQIIKQNFQNVDSKYLNLAGKKVIILGGGDTAMDCCRTAVRQNAKSVNCLYRRDKENMPGSKKEFENAYEEGVKFTFNSQPLEITYDKDNNVTGVKIAKTILKNKNTLELISNSEEIIRCDTVIIAFVFKPSPNKWFSHFNIETTKNGNTIIGDSYCDKHIYKENKIIVTERLDYQTTNKKVFAGGDMVRGADLVVTAIAEGRGAANSIIKFLNIYI